MQNKKFHVSISKIGPRGISIFLPKLSLDLPEQRLVHGMCIKFSLSFEVVRASVRDSDPTYVVPKHSVDRLFSDQVHVKSCVLLFFSLTKQGQVSHFNLNP